MGEVCVTSGISARPERGTAFFLFTLAVYQYALMTSVFADVRLGPANLQVTLVTLMLVVCAILRREKFVQALGWQSLVVIGLGAFFIPFKMLVGLLTPGGLQAMRVFFTLPLVWGVYAIYATDAVTRDKVARIIIWNCVFIALFGLIHFFFFPTVFLSQATSEAYRAGNIYLIPGHSAEAAFFGNSSGYGAILVTGLFAIYLTRRHSFPYVMAFFVITIASFLSISRATVLFGTVLLILYLIDGVAKRKSRGLIPIAVVIGMVLYVVARVPFIGLATQVAAGRAGSLAQTGGEAHSAFSDPSQIGRLQRYNVGLTITFRDLSHIFLGSADTEEPIIGDINFSDNSFIFLALDFGVPLALLWLVTVLRRTIGLRLTRDLRSITIFLFIYVTLITTPSLSWDMWLVYAVGLLFIGEPAPVQERLEATGYAY